ncbi:alanine racemase [Pseudolysinimonas yzui]|uniref:Alanine racemase n=1 Tax=Pseudolysinimonas yzui TaxID=2708254 RepID=A0A8J3GNQ3_9MICO|nr:alanine racemase [Pseudolysinimonas yzui]GHF08313.1 alanine racemase [Pseudolysinimonas yzui]
MSARIEIDLEAFRQNVRALATIAAPARTMLAVKADGYGHGMLPIARAALQSGADSLAVLDAPAALALRDAGIDAQLFAWLHGRDTDFRAAIEADVDLGVSSLVELRRIGEAGAGRPAAVHLKIDTGLHRNGASPEDWPALVGEALAYQERGQVRLAGLWSHLADASPADDAAALAEFQAAVAVAAGIGVPMEGPDRPLLHLAASSAGIRMPEARFDLVRFGIAAYGVSPFDDVDARGLGMRAPMTMRASVIAADGGTVALDLGSADGVPPSVLGPSGSGAEVLLGGRRVSVTAVGIDTIEVAATASVGDEAIVFGPGDQGEPTAEEWAGWAGTIGDEILARASTRIPRIYLNE